MLFSQLKVTYLFTHVVFQCICNLKSVLLVNILSIYMFFCHSPSWFYLSSMLPVPFGVYFAALVFLDRFGHHNSGFAWKSGTGEEAGKNNTEQGKHWSLASVLPIVSSVLHSSLL